MPQMFPLNWMFLFMLFTIIFMIFIIVNYYNISLLKKSKNNFFSTSFKKKINWKW
nr:ATP synthase F0 subunit 8 [Macrophya dolichogaster]